MTETASNKPSSYDVIVTFLIVVIIGLFAWLWWYELELRFQTYRGDLIEERMTKMQDEGLCITFEPILRKDNTIDAPYMREVCNVPKL